MFVHPLIFVTVFQESILIPIAQPISTNYKDLSFVPLTKGYLGGGTKLALVSDNDRALNDDTIGYLFRNLQ